MVIETFNSLSEAEARQLLADCNACETWFERVVSARPFKDVTQLKSHASLSWQNLSESDYLQAFEAHPMIGDVDSLRKKYASTKAMASGEQSGAAAADEQTLGELATLNKSYLQKFGFIFIVFATGKSAAEMLALLKARIGNSREEEIRNAAAEQLKITLLRIDKLFN
ncbi:2-oxo-4-hydroxy-4-carboxy-5-ureidoimidazoline decarboxylase [Turneriella parva]|uniref:2-oxo-4-hydroxy-4-carboxy-5-ureidoimidazoline decarboxylase n=1 Tax=Turneriella parva (strain ATCC BAA-1111 / DSM 21527 / NCTC 11395 / H) TaxID=869212 RepID=I4B3X1_TURPD|nr:2-oxo-4-hydroxy-4-carboxy-5-ureidoimidazoline decarboxylase [Turneriella parva]AFM11978.1 OHCU decarboxylase [Turneriella parva DSM 21527]